MVKMEMVNMDKNDQRKSVKNRASSDTKLNTGPGEM